MSNKDPRRQKANLETARVDPASLYDAEYYSNGCDIQGETQYGRHEPWLSFFRHIAITVKRKYRPKTAVDVGCAYGLLVEALVDQGIDAYGYDVSPFAISNARSDMRQRMNVHSLLEPVPLRNGQKYDMAFCIEVLEHIPPENADTALDNLCAASDLILFSSSPDDFDEPTHFNVLPTIEWQKKFEARGFRLARPSAAPYVAPHTFVVTRAKRQGIFSRLFG